MRYRLFLGLFFQAVHLHGAQQHENDVHKLSRASDLQVLQDRIDLERINLENMNLHDEKIVQQNKILNIIKNFKKSRSVPVSLLNDYAVRNLQEFYLNEFKKK